MNRANAEPQKFINLCRKKEDLSKAHAAFRQRPRASLRQKSRVGGDQGEANCFFPRSSKRLLSVFCVARWRRLNLLASSRLPSTTCRVPAALRTCRRSLGRTLLSGGARSATPWIAVRWRKFGCVGRFFSRPPNSGDASNRGSGSDRRRSASGYNFQLQNRLVFRNRGIGIGRRFRTASFAKSVFFPGRRMCWSSRLTLAPTTVTGPASAYGLRQLAALCQRRLRRRQRRDPSIQTNPFGAHLA